MEKAIYTSVTMFGYEINVKIVDATFIRVKGFDMEDYKWSDVIPFSKVNKALLLALAEQGFVDKKEKVFVVPVETPVEELATV